MKAEEHEKHFTGWFIQRDLVALFDQGKLSAIELLLLAMIESLARNNKEGCYATNQYLADRFGLKADTMSKMVARLIRLGLLVVLKFDGKRRYLGMGSIGLESYAASDTNPRGPGLKSDAPVIRALYKFNKQANTVGPSGPNGFFSPSTIPQTFTSKATKVLEKHIREKRRLFRVPNQSKWMKTMDALLQDLGGDQGRLKRVLIWYTKNSQLEKMVVVHSAEQFREKFTRIEARMNDPRTMKKLPTTFTPTSEDQKLLGYLEQESLNWPKGSSAQLPRCLHFSRVRYEEWRKCVQALAVDEAVPDRLRRFANHALPLYFSHPSHFIVQWFVRVNEQVAGWDEWAGSLEPYIWDPEHKLFQTIGTEAADQFAHNGGLWPKLLAYTKK